MKYKTISGFIITSFIFLSALCIGASGQNSLDHPVLFNTATGQNGTAAPYLYVKNTSKYAYESLIAGTDNAKTYSFEDADDYDFNDVVIKVAVTNDYSEYPVINITHLKKDADYDHEIWISLNIPAGYKALFSGAYYSSGRADIKIFSSSSQSVGATAEVKIVPAEDFSLSIDPQSITIQQKGAGSYSVYVEFKNGFSGNVSLSAKNLPADTTAVFNPNPVQGKDGDKVKSSLIISTGKNAPVGKYNITIRGETSASHREISAELNIIEMPDFKLSVKPETARLEPGGSALFSVIIKSLAGFKDTVKLSAENLAEGLTANFEPVQITSEGTALLTIVSSPLVKNGTYQFRVKGASKDLVHYSDATIDILNYSPDITITKQSDKSVVTVGEEIKFTISCKNTGDIKLQDLKVTDSLDPAFEFISASPKPIINGSELNFELGSLETGESRNIEIRIKVKETIDASGRASNFAIVSSDRIPSKKSNTVVIEIGKPSISLVKNIKNFNPNFRPGGVVIYELILKNRGSAPIFNLQIKDLLPRGFYYITGRTLVNGSLHTDPVVQGSEIIWKFDSLNAGSELKIIYQVSISADAKNGRQLNTAEAFASDGAGRNLYAGPAQAIVTISRGVILIYSAIEGIVFEDSDSDNVFGGDDLPVPDIWVTIETGEKVKTDSQGVFIFDSVLPGEHLVAIDTRSLPEYYEPVFKYSIANPLEGGRDYINIPLRVKPEGAIAGKIVWENQSNPPVSFSFKGMKVILDEKFYTESDENGLFGFKNVTAGKHIITLYSETIPQGLQLKTSPEIEVDVLPRKTTDADFILTGTPYGAIEGRLVTFDKDSSNSPIKKPVSDIKIFLNITIAALTDVDGRFTFPGLLPGKYEVKVDKSALDLKHYGLKSPETIQVNVEAGKIQILEFTCESLAFLEIRINK